MLTFQEMALRFALAIVLGAIIGFEREVVGKEAGVRTGLIVASGASIFAMIANSLPYITATSQQELNNLIVTGSYFGVIANIVVGIGFLGAGLIIKSEGHIQGLTTAATIWFIAAVGVLVGIGLMEFAVLVTVIISVLLYLLRNIDFHERFQTKGDK